MAQKIYIFKPAFYTLGKRSTWTQHNALRLEHVNIFLFACPLFTGLKWQRSVWWKLMSRIVVHQSGHSSVWIKHSHSCIVTPKTVLTKSGAKLALSLENTWVRAGHERIHELQQEAMWASGQGTRQSGPHCHCWLPSSEWPVHHSLPWPFPILIGTAADGGSL